MTDETPAKPEPNKLTRDERLKKLASNPRFKEAPKSGTGVVIVGAKS